MSQSYGLTEHDDLEFSLVFAVDVLGDDLVHAALVAASVDHRELGVVVHVIDGDIVVLDLNT